MEPTHEKQDTTTCPQKSNHIVLSTPEELNCDEEMSILTFKSVKRTEHDKQKRCFQILAQKAWVNCSHQKSKFLIGFNFDEALKMHPTTFSDWSSSTDESGPACVRVNKTRISTRNELVCQPEAS